jgi:hypothetical protein
MAALLEEGEVGLSDFVGLHTPQSRFATGGLPPQP